MPAIGVAGSDIAHDSEGHAHVFGQATGFDTSSFTVGDLLYVSPTGGFTNVRPTGINELVQNMGRTLRSDASQGRVLLLGPGRSNDVPNSGDFASLTVEGVPVGFGDVVGPSSATDNALVRYDGTTGGLAQDSLVIIDDNGVIMVPDQSANPGSPGAGKHYIWVSDGTADGFDGDLMLKTDDNSIWNLLKHGAGADSFLGMDGGASPNTSDGTSSTLVGGFGNNIRAAANYSTIGGGSTNDISASTEYATVAGGLRNEVKAGQSTICGGADGEINGIYSFIGGGDENTVNGTYSIIVGGNANTTSSSTYNIIVGGNSNEIAAGDYNMILGGFNNDMTTTNDYNIIVGGEANAISGVQEHAFIGGGTLNSIDGRGGYIGGGQNNDSINASSFSTIGGGSDNRVTASYGVVAGGDTNTAGQEAFVGGGNTNQASGRYCFVGGGINNATSNVLYSTIAGGNGNKAYALASFIGGGVQNVAAGIESVVCGGDNNQATEINSAIAGGRLNGARADYSFIGGGELNSASGDGSFIGGGHSNITTGVDSCVPGGLSNQASKDYSTSLGKEAVTRNKGEITQSAGSFSSAGDSQIRRLHLRRQTTSATTLILSDDNANDSGGSWRCEEKTLQSYEVVVMGHKDDDSEFAKYTFDGLIQKAVGSNPTSLDSNKTVNYESDASWDCDIAVGFGGIKINVTGVAATNINWTAKVVLTESTVA
jgi:hypothetical protein